MQKIFQYLVNTFAHANRLVRKRGICSKLFFNGFHLLKRVEMNPVSQSKQTPAEIRIIMLFKDHLLMVRRYNPSHT